ncbi:MAG: peptidyl-prolyl cis-trans isomerase [Treponema sp.]|nr:peptidyl-prolyl cis-trans isomerase [Treponema sp.]
MKRTIFFLTLLTLLSVSGFAQANLQPAATVNLIRSEVITVGQLRTEVDRMEKSAGRVLTQAERSQVLDVMINERLAIQAAERDRVTVTENEVNQQIQELRSQMAQQIGRQPTDAEFNQAIREQSALEMPAFREQLRKQLIVQKYLLSKKSELLGSVKVPTEAEISTQYNNARTEFVRPETVRFSMIQVPYGADAAARNRARDLANQLIREIGSNPSKFDEIVLRSAAPNSGYQAGDAGYLPRNSQAVSTVGQVFIDIAFSLRQGEVSRLIEGIQGFQIIKVTENHAMRNLELDDIAQLGTRITVRQYIGQTMLNQRQQAVLTQATQELTTELRAGRTFQVFDNNIRW